MLYIACLVVSLFVVLVIALIVRPRGQRRDFIRRHASDLSISILVAVLASFWISIPAWGIIYFPLRFVFGYELDTSHRYILFAAVFVCTLVVALLRAISLIPKSSGGENSYLSLQLLIALHQFEEAECVAHGMRTADFIEVNRSGSDFRLSSFRAPCHSGAPRC